MDCPSKRAPFASILTCLCLTLCAVATYGSGYLSESVTDQKSDVLHQNYNFTDNTKELFNKLTLLQLQANRTGNGKTFQNGRFTNGLVDRRKRALQEPYPPAPPPPYMAPPQADQCPAVATSCPICLDSISKMPRDINICNFEIILRFLLISPLKRDGYGRICGKMGLISELGRTNMKLFRRLIQFSVADNCNCPILRPSQRYFILSNTPAWVRVGPLYGKLALSAVSIIFPEDRYIEAELQNLLRQCTPSPYGPQSYVPPAPQPAYPAPAPPPAYPAPAPQPVYPAPAPQPSYPAPQPAYPAPAPQPVYPAPAPAPAYPTPAPYQAPPPKPPAYPAPAPQPYPTSAPYQPPPPKPPAYPTPAPAYPTQAPYQPPPPKPPAYPAPAPQPMYPAPAPAPVYVAPAPVPVYVAPAPAPVYVAPAPAPAYVAPAPAPAYVAPAPMQPPALSRCLIPNVSCPKCALFAQYNVNQAYCAASYAYIVVINVPDVAKAKAGPKDVYAPSPCLKLSAKVLNDVTKGKAPTKLSMDITIFLPINCACLPNKKGPVIALLLGNYAPQPGAQVQMTQDFAILLLPTPGEVVLPSCAAKPTAAPAPYIAPAPVVVAVPYSSKDCPAGIDNTCPTCADRLDKTLETFFCTAKFAILAEVQNSGTYTSVATVPLITVTAISDYNEKKIKINISGSPSRCKFGALTVLQTVIPKGVAYSGPATLPFVSLMNCVCPVLAAPPRTKVLLFSRTLPQKLPSKVIHLNKDIFLVALAPNQPLPQCTAPAYPTYAPPAPPPYVAPTPPPYVAQTPPPYVAPPTPKPYAPPPYVAPPTQKPYAPPPYVAPPTQKPYVPPPYVAPPSPPPYMAPPTPKPYAPPPYVAPPTQKPYVPPPYVAPPVPAPYMAPPTPKPYAPPPYVAPPTQKPYAPPPYVAPTPAPYVAPAPAPYVAPTPQPYAAPPPYVAPTMAPYAPPPAPAYGACLVQQPTCPRCLNTLPQNFRDFYCMSQFVMVIAIGVDYSALQREKQDAGYLPFVYGQPSPLINVQSPPGQMSQVVVQVTAAKTSGMASKPAPPGNSCYREKVRALYDVTKSTNPYEKIVDLDCYVPARCGCSVFDLGPSYGLVMSTKRPPLTQPMVPLQLTDEYAYFPLPVGQFQLPNCGLPPQIALPPSPPVYEQTLASYGFPTRAVAPYAPQRGTCPQGTLAGQCPMCHQDPAYLRILCSMKFAVLVQLVDTGNKPMFTPAVSINQMATSQARSLNLDVRSYPVTSPMQDPSLPYRDPSALSCRKLTMKVIKDLTPIPGPKITGSILKAFVIQTCSCHFMDMSNGYAVLLSEITPVAIPQYGFQLSSTTHIVCLPFGPTTIPQCQQAPPPAPYAPSPVYAPPPAPTYAPTPAPYKPPPAPTYAPTPAPYKPPSPTYASPPAPTYAPPPMPTYAPAPVLYKPPPSPIYAPPPAPTYAPAPTPYKPPPPPTYAPPPPTYAPPPAPTYAPTPAPYKPPPPTYAPPPAPTYAPPPAPIYAPAPVPVYAPAPSPVYAPTPPYKPPPPTYAPPPAPTYAPAPAPYKPPPPSTYAPPPPTYAPPPAPTYAPTPASYKPPPPTYAPPPRPIPIYEIPKLSAPMYAPAPAPYAPPPAPVYAPPPAPVYAPPPAPVYAPPPAPVYAPPPAPVYAPPPAPVYAPPPAPVYAPPPAPTYAPTPAPYKAPPSPTYAPSPAPVYAPAPAPVYAPAPAPYKPPPPPMYVPPSKPAPIYEMPKPATPQYAPPPPVYKPPPPPVYAPPPPPMYSPPPPVYSPPQASVPLPPPPPLPTTCIAPADSSCPVCSNAPIIPPDSYCNAPLALTVRGTGTLKDDMYSPCFSGSLLSLYDVSTRKTAQKAVFSIVFTIPKHCVCPILKGTGFAVLLVKRPIPISSPMLLQLSSMVEIHPIPTGQLTLPSCMAPSVPLYPRAEGMPEDINLPSVDKELQELRLNVEGWSMCPESSCPRCKAMVEEEVKQMVCSSNEALILEASDFTKIDSIDQPREKISVKQKLSQNYTIQIDIKPEEEEKCFLSLQEGECNSFTERFYYNFENEVCENFTYSGCGGNANNFEKLEDCEDACIEPSLCKQGSLLIKDDLKGIRNNEVTPESLKYTLHDNCDCPAIRKDGLVLVAHNNSMEDNSVTQLNANYYIVPLPKDHKVDKLTCTSDKTVLSSKLEIETTTHGTTVKEDDNDDAAITEESIIKKGSTSESTSTTQSTSASTSTTQSTSESTVTTSTTSDSFENELNSTSEETGGGWGLW